MVEELDAHILITSYCLFDVNAFQLQAKFHHDRMKNDREIATSGLCIKRFPDFAI